MSLEQLISVNFIKDIQSKALCEIKNNRQIYTSVYEIVEEFCDKNDIIISDKYTILEKQDSLMAIFDKNYKLYTVNPFKHSNDLVNRIHYFINENKQIDDEQNDNEQIDDKQNDKQEDAKQIDKQNNKTKSKCKNQIINISEYLKTCLPFIRLKTIKEQEEFTIDFDTRPMIQVFKLQKRDILLPVQIKNNLYMPSEIELIDVYHELYTNNNYELSYEYEKLLFDQVSKRKESGIFI